MPEYRYPHEEGPRQDPYYGYPSHHYQKHNQKHHKEPHYHKVPHHYHEYPYKYQNYPWGPPNPQQNRYQEFLEYNHDYMYPRGADQAYRSGYGTWDHDMPVMKKYR